MIGDYLRDCRDGKLVRSKKVMNNLQEIFYLVETADEGATAESANSSTLLTYLATMLRSAGGLEKLIDNKVDIKEKRLAAEEAKARKARQAQVSAGGGGRGMCWSGLGKSWAGIDCFGFVLEQSWVL